MPEQIPLNITLPPEQERWVTARIASGRYATASEAIQDGLRLLEEREAALEEVRRKIAVGIEQTNRGEFLDGDTVFDELLADLPPDGAAE